VPKAPLWGNWKVEIRETCLRPATARQAETKLVYELDVYADRRFSEGVSEGVPRDLRDLRDRCDLWEGMPLAQAGRSVIRYGLERLCNSCSAGHGGLLRRVPSGKTRLEIECVYPVGYLYVGDR